jgi:23S rRNA-/tRNA-specific pseudouridylate synthase
LDRGASGALLFAFANEDIDESDGKDYFYENGEEMDDRGDDGVAMIKGATSILIQAMTSPDSVKTYLALVRGEGILGGVDLKEKGWFEVNRPIKDEDGVEKEASTLFHFVAGQPETNVHGVDRPRMSLVLARPKQGRWHQIRRHLNGLSHPILGDTTHGASKVNREWKEKRNLPGERICLHLARLQIPSNDAVPQGIDVCCPILEDMLSILRVYAPDVLEKARPVLEREGIVIEPRVDYKVGRYRIPHGYNLREKNRGDEDVSILDQGEHYVVVDKPPSVVVHNSAWSDMMETTPMLQRVRDKTGKKVNPIHRLDRGRK